MSAVSKNQEPWLAAARRLDAKLGPLNWANGTTYHRRELLAAYDAQATELATLREQLAEIENKRSQDAEYWRLEAMGKDSALWAAAEMEEENKKLSALLREAQAAAADRDKQVRAEIFDVFGPLLYVGAGKDGLELSLQVRYELAGVAYRLGLQPMPAGHTYPAWIAKHYEVFHPGTPLLGRIEGLETPPAPACPSTCTDCGKAAACEVAPALYHEGQPVWVKVEGEEYESTVVSARHLGRDGWVYKVDIKGHLAGMSVFDYVESRLRPCTMADFLEPEDIAEPPAAGSLPSGGEAAKLPAEGEVWCGLGGSDVRVRILKVGTTPARLVEFKYAKSGKVKTRHLRTFTQIFGLEVAAPTTIEKEGGPDE